MKRAIFLDRDGIINELCYDQEKGIIEGPLVPQQVRLVFGITKLLKSIKKLGYLLIIISNQPNLALKKINKENFNLVSGRIINLLKKEDVLIDGQYYCLHHPFAKVAEYRKKCECRKPGIGLFLQAIKEFKIDVESSWMIGDGVMDIIAGKKAGCKTILLANIESSDNLSILEKQLKGIKPDFVIKKLPEAIKIISANE